MNQKFYIKRASQILNCGQAKQKSELVRFTYKCPKQWDNLQTIANKSIRFCDVCQENVYHCTNKQEAEQHARQGNCIAIAPQLSLEVYDQYTPMMLGRPDTNVYWAKDIFDNPKHWLVETIRKREMIPIDLNHSDLSNVDLSKADLREVNLSSANLRNTNLSGSNLSNTNLSQANFKGANLSGANLSNANLTNTNLINTNLSNANLSGVELNYALKNEFAWSRVNLDGVILEPRHRASYLNGKGRAFIFGDRSLTRQQAIEYLQQALLIIQELSDRQLEIPTLYNLVSISLPEEKQQAEVYSQQLLSLIEELGDRQQEVQTLDKLAALYNKHGATQSAIEYYQQALLIKIELGDYPGEGKILSTLGKLFLRLGDKSQAFAYFQQALAKSDGLKNPLESGNNLHSLIKIGEALGDQQELLLNYYHRLLFKRRANEVKILDRIGNLYLELGNNHQAIAYLQRRTRLIEKSVAHQKLTYYGAEIYILKLMIMIYEKLNDFPALLQCYQELLSLHRSIGDCPQPEASFNELTRNYLEGREKQQPPAIVQDLLVLRKKVLTQTIRKQNLIDLCIGRLYLDQDKIQQAIEYLQSGLTVVRHLRKQPVGSRGYYALESAHTVKQKLSATIEHLNQDLNEPLNLSPYCQQLLENRAKNRQLEREILTRISKINLT